jgi:glutathione S-transferase
MSMIKRGRYRITRSRKSIMQCSGLLFKSRVILPPFHHIYIRPFILTITGQGPYTGQATWFSRFHPEKLPSAISRYVDEILRVISVLDTGLQRNGTGWLVGGKCTYADLAFRAWADVGEGVLKEQRRDGGLDDFPRYKEWVGKMDGLEGVKKIQERMREGRRAHRLS